MVFCVVCASSTPPMLTLNVEEMKIYDAMVSPFINLELLVKSHTILVCSDCKGQLDVVQQFQTMAVAGARHLQAFLLGNDLKEEDSDNVAEEATTQQEPGAKAESETANTELESKHDIKMELCDEVNTELEREEVYVENVGGAATDAPTAVDPLAADVTNEGDPNRYKTASNAAKPAVLRHKRAKILTNGNTAIPSTSGAQSKILQTSIQPTSGISKSNMYNPKFLNKYFSEALSQTKKSESENVPNNSISAAGAPRPGAAPATSSTTNAECRKTHRISSETRHRIVALNHEGLSVSEIADELGTTYKTASNAAKPAVLRHKRAKILTNGNTAIPSTSGAQSKILQTSTQPTSGISKSNLYNPKFLNKYFSEALSQTKKSESENVPNNSISTAGAPRPGAAPATSSTTNAECRKTLRISSETRHRIVALNHEGLSVSEIADELGTTRNTVKLWLKRWKLEGHLFNHVSVGRPRCTSLRQDIKMLRQAREQRSLNTALFAEDFGMSPATIRRRLAEGGLRNLVPSKKPALTSRHKTLRLKFAAEHLNRNFDDVVFVDDKVFCSNDNGRLSLLRPGNISSRYTRRTLDGQSGPITICFWGWMSAGGPGELVEIPGRLNAIRYKNILEESFLPTAEIIFPNQNITFVQNQSAFHNSRFVQLWINEQSNLTLLKMPPHSPDLNPLENLWGKIIQEWDPIPNQYKDIDALRAHVLQAWESFRGQSFCRDLVGSMRKRLRDVLKAEGGYTKY